VYAGEATAEKSAVPLPEVASRLRLAVMRLSRRLRQHSPVGITQSQLSALATIVVQERITLSGLAEAEQVQPPSITRVVDVSSARAMQPAPRATQIGGWRGSSRPNRAAPSSRPCAGAATPYLAERLRSFTPEDRDVLARASVLLERLTQDPR